MKLKIIQMKKQKRNNLILYNVPESKSQDLKQRVEDGLVKILSAMNYKLQQLVTITATF